MAPPTGASDSILLVRRNGASLEPHYGALVPQFQKISMETNQNRNKRTWIDKWNVSRGGKLPIDGPMIETSNFMIHPDYLQKYGTLSNGVVTKSLKYAETWLYGTVGVRGSPAQRPSLFVYPGVVPPPARIINESNYLTSVGTFRGLPFAKTSSTDHKGYVALPFRKHPDQSMQSLQGDSITVYPGSECGKNIQTVKKISSKKHVISNNGTLTKNSPSTRDSSCYRDKRVATSASSDPYNLMRKNRLEVCDATKPSGYGTDHFQGKRQSPSVLQLTSSGFESFKPVQGGKENSSWEEDEQEWPAEDEEVGRRKSILECEVNAYELNKSKSADFHDSSDESGRNTPKVEPSKLKISRPKLSNNKTELRTGGSASVAEAEKAKSENSNSNKLGVRVNGQRPKAFDKGNPSTTNEKGHGGDDGNGDGDHRQVQVPGGGLPKRPPRRHKEKTSNEVALKYAKCRSKSSPNLSIKSILKKPPGGEDTSPVELPIDQESLVPEGLDLQSLTLTSKLQTQSTLKKKKQVQFNVNSYESTNKIVEISFDQNGAVVKCDLSKGNADDISENFTAGEDERRSKSCDQTSSLDHMEKDCSVTKSTVKQAQPECEDQHLSTDIKAEDVHTRDISHVPWPGLKRSYSDRRLNQPPIHRKDDRSSLPISSSTVSPFNDTMALRIRASKLDTRQVFSNSWDKNSADSSNSKSEKLSGNIITYAEFSKLLDAPRDKRQNVGCRPPNRKSNISIKSSIPVKAKYRPAPSPPLRQGTIDKSKSVRTRLKLSQGEKSENFKSVSNADTSKTDKVTVGLNGRCATPPADPRQSGQQSVHCGTESSDGKTVVTLTSNFGKDSEAHSSECKRPSITIHPKNIMDERKGESKRKTSVIISNFHPEDTNKVRINVTTEPSANELNSSTCTIIETGSNATVIPVVSTDNKTTLIVGSNVAVASNVGDNLSPSALFPLSSNGTVSDWENQFPQSPLLGCDKSIQMLDPVEAVRRNLVPHICGKTENVNVPKEETRLSRASTDQENLKQILQLFVNADNEVSLKGKQVAPDSLLASYKTKKSNCKNTLKSGESSTTTSRSNSFCSTLNSSGKYSSSSNTSRSNSFRGSCCKKSDVDCESNQDFILPGDQAKVYTQSDVEDASEQEKDKMECEYEVRNGFKEDKKHDVENIYEAIREEPIYDQIKGKKNVDDGEEKETPSSSPSPPPLPLPPPPPSASNDSEAHKSTVKSMFEGASKYDILSYLVDAKERVQEEGYFTGSSIGEDADCKRSSSSHCREKTSLQYGNPPTCLNQLESDKGSECRSTLPPESDSGIDLNNRFSQISNSSDDNFLILSPPEKHSLKVTRKGSAEVERNDSGVGSEASHASRSKWQVSRSSKGQDHQHTCEDCDQSVETRITDSGVKYVPLVCRKCAKKRSERKEIIQEIVETEEKYGRDLKIILDEFYTPMLVAGLLTPDQLSAIFLNTVELLENSEMLTERLRDTLDIALEQGDEDLLTVNIGKLFLEAGPMLHAFESYCTRQGAAAMLLTNLEKEKELLRIFLRVSQMENTVLRRMNLNSFLMVPVQRVTKYPLLLARLYKVTPAQQESRESLKEARHNIELHLEHMNSVSKEAKDVSGTKVWRRFSTSTISGRKSTTELEMINIKLRKMAVDVLEWNHEEVRFVLEGKLLYTQPTDNNWKRGRTIKLASAFVLLVTLGKPNSKYKIDPSEDELIFHTKTGIREATLLLVKEKCGRYSMIREPLYLDKIIVCCESEVDEYFEVQELSTKESFIFKAEDGERTKEWYKQLQYHAQILGSWRKRRNALANIMINGMMARAHTS